MSQINNVDVRPLFTKVLVALYREAIQPTGFLRSLFRTVESSSKEVSIEVQRTTEKVAVDVFRGTEGNRNELSNFSEKVFIPPYFREYIDHTSIRHYDVMFGEAGQVVSETTFSEIVQDVANDLAQLTAKIERAYEVMAAQVLQTGIVTLVSGTNIDFKRKADSLVDLGATNYWADSGVNPVTSIEAACLFLRKVGKAQGGEFNVYLGATALTDLLDSTEFQNKANLRRVAIVDISMPQRQADAVGSVFHGIISAGSFTVRIWTYPQFRDVAGVSTPYIDDKNMIVTPMVPNFVMSFASVPKIVRDEANAEFPQFIRQAKGAFTVGNFVDERNEVHVFDVKSAGVPIPVAVDTIHTTQVVA